LGAAVLEGAAFNTLVLYHTSTADGKDVAVSGAIAIPKGNPPPGGWPIISWAHGTTGNAPQCAPTRLAEANAEQSYLESWIEHGYAVLQTDYEGQGTPGLHPYFVGVSAAHDVIDIVRAARRLYPQLGTRWFVLGHSEGASATLFTAVVAPGWAPELQLQGAVAFAPPAKIASFFKSFAEMKEPGFVVPFALEMIEGIASVDRSIDLSKLLSPAALARLPELQQKCTSQIFRDEDFMSLPPAQIFRDGANTRALYDDFVANEDDRLHFTLPLLILQGDADQIVSPELTTTLDYELCSSHTPVTYDELPGKTHTTIVTETFATASAWVDAVASGKPPAPNCS
jgi:pimeloyl-ACP methyl ester carboxylesterase